MHSYAGAYAAGGGTGLERHYRFSTEGLSDAEAFERWHGEFSTLFDARLERGSRIDCEVDGWRLGSTLLLHQRWPRADAPLARIHRDAGKLRRDGYDFCYLRIGLARGARFAAGERQVRAGRGQPLLIDVAQSLRGELPLGDAITLAVPRDALHGSFALRHASLAEGELGRILADHLMSLSQALPRLSAAEFEALVPATERLLAACLAPTRDALERARGELERGRFERVRRYIDRHLESPRLDPERICAAVGLSRSSLYRLFAGLGGVAHYVQRRRLRRIRYLLSTGRADAPAKAMAYRYGFKSDSHFARAFKQAFGCTPAQARELPPLPARQVLAGDGGASLPLAALLEHF